MSTTTITAGDINKLRQMTGAGMMDCRKALQEADGDFEKAIDYLRKKGQKIAALRSDREAKEGVIIAKTNKENKRGIIICLACETDFVAKNEDFVKFSQAIADLALTSKANTLEELKALQMDGVTLADKVSDQVARIGEKIELSKFEVIEAEGVASYIHGNYRMGVLVGLNQNNAAALDAGKDVAMQIAAMKPVAVDAQSVPADVVAREKDIVMEQIKNDPKMAGKPLEMLEKVGMGKLNAFFKESTLMGQAFVKDNSKTVSDYLGSVDKGLKVVSFKRIQLG
ncbi:MAG: translation elongation factor Ts [Chitinophagaceae bacterium]|nr:translation elongation factor Ts [Chitinophagaceae bacterium]